MVKCKTYFEGRFIVIYNITKPETKILTLSNLLIKFNLKYFKILYKYTVIILLLTLFHIIPFF